LIMGKRKTVRFYYSVGSRYSYLASTQVEKLERERGCQVLWRPLYSVDLYELRGVSPFEGNQSRASTIGTTVATTPNAGLSTTAFPTRSPGVPWSSIPGCSPAPAPRRTPIAATALPFMVRLDSDGATTVQLTA
jgi:hypothetical protein